MMSDASKIGISPFPVSTATAQEWERWKRTLGFYFVAENIKDAEQKQAKLIILGGKEIQDLYYSLPRIDEIPTGKDAYTYTIQCLDGKIGVQSTKWYERYMLAQIRQSEKEMATSFITRVRNQALKCEYETSYIDEAIQGQLINGCASSNMRIELMKTKPTASLAEFEDVMRTFEIISEHLSAANLSRSFGVAVSTNATEQQATDPEFLALREECEDARSKATFDFVIENFSQISQVEGGVVSESCMIRNLPWRIMAMQKSASPSNSLGVFLQCNGESESSSWSCLAKAQLILLSQKEGVEEFSRKIQHLFYSKENDWGFSHFMSWNEVTNPDRGYIKDDTIILRAVVNADVADDADVADESDDADDADDIDEEESDE